MESKTPCRRGLEYALTVSPSKGKTTLKKKDMLIMTLN